MYDVIIIGAGVTGCAAARELSAYRGNFLVIEKGEDVCCGTSKANSAIIHAGFDAEPGTKKAYFNVLGNRMMDKIAKELDIPFKRNGAYVLCTDKKRMPEINELLERGEKNGVKNLCIRSRKEILKDEPNLSDDVVCALYAKDSGIVCPFNMTAAYAENACENGVKFSFDNEVRNIVRNGVGYEIETKKGKYITRAVVNAAGVYSDVLHNMVSGKKLKITAKRGEYCLLDKCAGNHVSATMFQLPGTFGKGVLVTPTVHGNLLVGPTSEAVMDKEAVNTTAAGLGGLFATASLGIKNVPSRQVITSFAGLRAHEEGGDFVIGEPEDAPLFFDAAGIESPGLSSAPAIGLWLAEEISKALSLNKNESFNPIRHGIVRPSELSERERSRLIKENPAYGNIVCRCEGISEGEIRDAVNRPVGARSLDGVKRRTRAGMGRCQSGFCSPKTMEIISEELGIPLSDVTKCGGESKIITGVNKE